MGHGSTRMPIVLAYDFHHVPSHEHAISWYSMSFTCYEGWWPISAFRRGCGTFLS